MWKGTEIHWKIIGMENLWNKKYKTVRLGGTSRFDKVSYKKCQVLYYNNFHIFLFLLLKHNLWSCYCVHSIDIHRHAYTGC